VHGVNAKALRGFRRIATNTPGIGLQIPIPVHDRLAEQEPKDGTTVIPPAIVERSSML
jgi:hypothetical protein